MAHTRPSTPLLLAVHSAADPLEHAARVIAFANCALSVFHATSLARSCQRGVDGVLYGNMFCTETLIQDPCSTF